MQEQKAENTGRQFCSCFYQLLGIGGPEARAWQDASWGVRVGTYVSLAYHLSLSLSFSVFLFILSSSSFTSFSSSLLPLWRIYLFSPFGPARRFVPPSRLPFSSLFPRSLHAPLAGSSSRLAAFGYHLGHRGHPPRCTRYVVCPIFTHGKSTLKRRWTPVRFSFPSSLPSTTKPRSSSIPYHGCFSISADRVKIGSQRFAQGENPLFGGSEKCLSVSCRYLHEHYYIVFPLFFFSCSYVLKKLTNQFCYFNKMFWNHLNSLSLHLTNYFLRKILQILKMIF